MIRFFAALMFLVVAASCGSERLSWWRVAVDPNITCPRPENHMAVTSSLPTMQDWEFFRHPDGKFVLTGSDADLGQTLEGLDCKLSGQELACGGFRTTRLSPGTGPETEIAQTQDWLMEAWVEGDRMQGLLTRTFSTACNRGCAEFTPVPGCKEQHLFRGIKLPAQPD